jgi:hypothetical protein
MGDLFTRRLVTADLTLSRYRALAALWEKGDQRLGDLAEASSFRLYLAWSENWRGGSGRAVTNTFEVNCPNCGTEVLVGLRLL